MAITAITPEDTICEGDGTSGSLENTQHLIPRMTITAITSEETVCERDGTSGSLQEHNILYWGWQSLQSHQRKLWRRRDLAIFARTQQIIRRKAIAAIAPEEIVCEGDRTSGYLQEHNILFCKNTTYYTEAISAITPEETVCDGDRTSGSLDEHSILYWGWQLLQSHQRKLFVKLTGPRDLWKIHNILFWGWQSLQLHQRKLFVKETWPRDLCKNTTYYSEDGNHCSHVRGNCLWRRRDLGISARTQHIILRMAITAVTSEETVCEGDVTWRSLQEHNILFWGWQSLQSRQRKLFVKETWPRDLCKNTTYYTEAISANTPEEAVCEADRTARSLENTQHIILRMAITAITPEEAVCEGDVTSGSLQEHNVLFWGWQSLQSRQRKLVKWTGPRDLCKNKTYFTEHGNHCNHTRGNCLWRWQDLGISGWTQHIILRMAITAITPEETVCEGNWASWYLENTQHIILRMAITAIAPEETVCEGDRTSGYLQESIILCWGWQSLPFRQRKLSVKWTGPRDFCKNPTYYTEDGNHCNHTRGNCLWSGRDLRIFARIRHTMLRIAITAITPEEIPAKWTGPQDLSKNTIYYSEDVNHCNHARGNCMWSRRHLGISGKYAT